MKIYAITKGNYSGYHICALTTSLEKAKKIKRAYTDPNCYGDEQAKIEEYEDGDVNDIRTLWLYDESGDIELIEGECAEGNAEKIGIYENTKEYFVYVLAEDADHARKKAHDMIAEYKARKEGIC